MRHLFVEETNKFPMKFKNKEILQVSSFLFSISNDFSVITFPMNDSLLRAGP